MHRHNVIAVMLLFAGVALGSCTAFESDDSGRYTEPAADTYTSRTLQVAAPGVSENVAGAEVSASFLTTSHAVPMLGRAFQTHDYQPDATPLAMLHHDFWRGAFKSDPSIIGKTIQIDGRPHVVIAVMPRGFNFPKGARVWVQRRSK
jgi:hypothetical protein